MVILISPDFLQALLSRLVTQTYWAGAEYKHKDLPALNGARQLSVRYRT
jgi:hypothetical protein